MAAAVLIDESLAPRSRLVRRLLDMVLMMTVAKRELPWWSGGAGDMRATGCRTALVLASDAAVPFPSEHRPGARGSDPLPPGADS